MPVIILTAGLLRDYGVRPVEVRHPLLSVHTGALQAPGDPGGFYSRYAAIGGAGGPADAFGQVCKPDILPHGLGLVYYRLCSIDSLLYYRTT